MFHFMGSTNDTVGRPWKEQRGRNIFILKFSFIIKMQLAKKLLKYVTVQNILMRQSCLFFQYFWYMVKIHLDFRSILQNIRLSYLYRINSNLTSSFKENCVNPFRLLRTWIKRIKSFVKTSPSNVIIHSSATILQHYSWRILSISIIFQWETENWRSERWSSKGKFYWIHTESVN